MTPPREELVGFVLCAGLGTRLRPLTDRVPKPAVPVGGLPLVRWSLSLLAGAGVRRAVVNVHHRPDEMAAAAREAAAALGLALEISREPVLAGTGGALREARALLRGAGTVVVVNGDVLFDVDLGAAVAAHRRHAAEGALATMVLLPMPAGATYNAVELDAKGAVRRLARDFGPGSADGAPLVPHHFSGVHVLSPGLLDRVPALPFESDVNRVVYPPLMASGGVRGHVVRGYWNDLGTPARYLEASRDLLAGRVPLARFPGTDPFAGSREPLPGVRAAVSARIAPGARLVAPVLVCEEAVVEAGATVGPEAIVGPGATVPAGAVVRRAVIWEGTALSPGESLEDAIAAGADRVPAGGG